VSELIHHQAFVKGCAMSLSEQPYLGQLFTEVGNPDTALTIVVGAGVSMNAGLRSWSELIRQMIRQIDDPRLRSMAEKDNSDLMRKAEIVLQLVKARDPGKPDHEIVRMALYPENFDASPGRLALSIARLVAAKRGPVTIITTNFDVLLEKALESYFEPDMIRSFGLESIADWRAWQSDGGVGVLHVHGVVRQSGRQSTRLVLTESQFFRSAAEVRQVIYESLLDSCSLFVGLSMSDPNLVGPIYELANQDRSESRFALVVPERIAGEDADASVHYAIESGKFMENKLRLKIVFLKSYSQLDQAVSDLSLRIVEPVRYRRRPADRSPSLVYEARLARELDECYRAIGCNTRQRVPEETAAAALNQRLHDALYSRRGPVRTIGRLARSIGEWHAGEDRENYALFLWLKCRQRGRVADGYRYALRMVGNSAFSHREEWSMWPEADIARESERAAAQAVFYGRPMATNAGTEPGSEMWKGFVSMPILVASTGSDATVRSEPADVLTVGAITLGSTRRVRLDRQLGPDERYSIVTKFGSALMQHVFDSLNDAAVLVLRPS
jgi:hypothetical protein